MEQLGVISRVSEPTEWCAGMVVVPKPNNTVRICVVRLTSTRVSVEASTPCRRTDSGSTGRCPSLLSKLDANYGFWQIPLSQESALLTTFIPPFGCYCFHRLPFGITSAPEHFQRCMSDLLSDLDGVVCRLQMTY